ncbi:hypothetical protein DN402_05980 [Streptomyces sp. SW4]|nr:hypothetical protein DN402_05980 [Streptomyces sp. SW4]
MLGFGRGERRPPGGAFGGGGARQRVGDRVEEGPHQRGGSAPGTATASPGAASARSRIRAMSSASNGPARQVS